MQQSYWHLTGNLWALSLSTAIALFMPEFGPKDIMTGGVGVVIRTTMVAKEAAEMAAAARQLEREAFIEFMRNKGVPSEEIDAFIRRLTQQD